jgi:His-Xaa-Ser system radical SAM maturase HxsC
MSYLEDGDIIEARESWAVVAYRAGSPHNSILLTERCDNFCLMCSQPPKAKNDTYRFEAALELARLLPRDTECFGITGGEPTLLGEGLVELLRRLRARMPEASLQVLSNGRAFADIGYAHRVVSAGQGGPFLVGVPLYGNEPAQHDYIVQARGAFDETVRGVVNLGRVGGSVELRVVVHRLTVDMLTDMAAYIARNLAFVTRVALMGLEVTGLTRANLAALWIDPMDCAEHVQNAVEVLSAARVPVRVFNMPLCAVGPALEPCYVRSVSDWKAEYYPACDGCARRVECGGFFAANIRYAPKPAVRPYR